MNRTYQYRLKTNQTQEKMLDFLLWQGRNIYNAALEQRIELYKATKETISLYDQRDYFCELRKEQPETIGLLPANTVDALIRRLDKAYKAFFRRVKKGDAAGFPKFKGRYYFNSLNYKHGSGSKFIPGENGKAKLRLMNIGEINVYYHRPIPDGAKIKYIVVKRDERGKWFANLQLEFADTETPEHPGSAVGIDVGMYSIMALSNGERVQNPRWYRKSRPQRRRLQRTFSRRTKGSGRWRKARAALAQHEAHIARARYDWWHKVTDQLTQNYSLIAIEDLKLDFMIQNKHLAMSAHDAAFSTFWQMLDYKAEQTGTTVIKVNPAYTSQMCSGCGEIVKKELNVRIHKCVSCGLELDRDVNAARNILNLALNGAGHAPHDLTQPNRAYVS